MLLLSLSTDPKMSYHEQNSYLSLCFWVCWCMEYTKELNHQFQKLNGEKKDVMKKKH